MEHENDVIVGNVYETYDYDKFRILPENRGVSIQRKGKIGRSIDANGYIVNPLITNEFLEVIDGQGRLQALKQRKMPIHYIIVPGLEAKACRVLNMANSNWTTENYIDSYAESGSKDYKNIKTLISRHRGIGVQNVICAVTGTMQMNGKIIREGRLKCDDRMFAESEKVIEYMERFKPYIDSMMGSSVSLFSAIRFCYSCPNIDNERMFEKFALKYKEMATPNDIKQCIKELEFIYNHKIRGECKVYFEMEYDNFLRGKYPWYDTNRKN